jgi:hypothetical protein
VLKQVRLFSDDYDVVTCGHGPKPEGATRHIEIPEHLALWRYDRALVATRRYRKAYWANPAIAYARSVLPTGEFDAVLANDVDAVGLALSLDAPFGVHADLHEYAPRQKEDVLRWRVFVAPFLRWMCRRFVRRANSVTTVGRGIADEYRRRFGIDADVVTNAAPYAELAPTAAATPIRLVHSGACLRDRNIATIVDAVEASTASVTLDLYLTPNDPQFLDELKERSRSSERVIVREPVPYSTLSSTLNRYDVGVHILPPVNFNNRWALPNKFFDYVQARLGVVIGPSPEMAGVLTAGGFGAVTEDFTVGALTRVLDGLDVDTVNGWKTAADEAAHSLSSDAQVVIWKRAVDALVGEEAR